MGKSSKIIQKHFEFLIFWFDIHNNMFPHIVKKFFLKNIEKCKCYECLTTIVFFSSRNGHHTVDRNIAPASSLSFSSSSSIVSLLGGASLSWEAEPGRLESPKANSGTFLVSRFTINQNSKIFLQFLGWQTHTHRVCTCSILLKQKSAIIMSWVSNNITFFTVSVKNELLIWFG